MTQLATILFSVLLAVRFGCSETVPGAEKKNGATEFISTGLPNSISKNRQQTTRFLGKPTKVSIEERANIHLPNVVDTLVALHFKGASIRYFVPGKGNPSEEFVIEAEITSPDLGLGQGVKLGDNMNKITSALGAPSNLYSDSLEYRDEMQNVAILHFKKGRLAKAKWEFYWD